MKRVMIAGTGSGCGKTTITCALLQALIHRKKRVASFKTGPDYIDPMFHRTIIGAPSHNLDPFFCGKDALCSLLTKYGEDFNIIEGAMGYFDGDSRSCCAVSEMTQTPVILVLNCQGMSDSIGAVMHGFLRYQAHNQIIGFIFNKLPEKLIPLAQRLCENLGTTFFGTFPKSTVTLESRHLGLVTADEISDIQGKMKQLAALAEQHLLMDRLLEIPDLPLPDFCHPQPQPFLDQPPEIAVAKDTAFCFIYPENLDILREFGCHIKFFSPLADTVLPDCDGLYLPGGYPELYAEKLSQNTFMREMIRKALQEGIPCIAECGGFLYLHESLKTSEGSDFPMVGFLRGNSFPTKRLQRFGYISIESSAPHLLAEPGQTLRGHEFHYWESSSPGNALHAVKPDGRSWDCCHVNDRFYAGFPHLYWYADTRPARRFVTACAAFREERHGTNQADLSS